MGPSFIYTFPIAMRISAIIEIQYRLLPHLQQLGDLFVEKARTIDNTIRVVRKSLETATLYKVLEGYAKQIEIDIVRLKQCLLRLHSITFGINLQDDNNESKVQNDLFDEDIMQIILEETEIPFVGANKEFDVLPDDDALVQASVTMNTVACSLNKISNDMDFLTSGPRFGLGIHLNKPNSKGQEANTHSAYCEAFSMVCTQIMGNHLQAS